MADGRAFRPPLPPPGGRQVTTALFDTAVEVETARHLYRALREGVPFPISNADALEVSRIIQVVKEQNPEFKWD